MAKWPILSSRQRGEPYLDVLNQLYVSQKESGGMYGFDESMEEACDGISEG